MGHSHDQDAGNIRRVQVALALTGTFMVVEVVGGILSGSLALLADAGHMLTDSMALALAVFAFRVSSKPADGRRSYGYQRVQIIAAFVNGLSLLVIVGWILFEAVMRLFDPPEVLGSTMLMVATAGLFVNIASFIVLHGGDQENLNIRGAALHVLGDLLGSVAAIIAAFVIIWTGWMPIDPILSVVVAMLILRSAWHLVKRSAHILLEGAPEWLDVDDMQAKIIAAVPEVSEIHHVHVWGLTPQHLMLTMHVVLPETVSAPTPVVRQVKSVLKSEFAIDHSTIEVEYGDCADH
ncbi:MAG: cation diffusion facilitator family transporter [Woeseiaceae bacterium]|jgi:cobalt-zinc-cadmium efflux system protein|nr:cation diffusion facilitator family transporter [Woeseiaceae bacterium]